MEFPDYMEEDFSSVSFNSYLSGPGAGLPLEHLPSYKRNAGAKENKGPSLYVTGIPLTMNKDGLINVFSPYGTVLQAHIGEPRQNKTTAFGFVTFGSMREAERALKALHRTEPFRFSIEFSSTKEERRKKEQVQREEQQKFRDLHQQELDNQQDYNDNSTQSSRSLHDHNVNLTSEAERDSVHSFKPSGYSSFSDHKLGLSAGRGFTPRSQSRVIRDTRLGSGHMQRETVYPKSFGRGQVLSSFGHYRESNAPSIIDSGRPCTNCKAPGHYQCQACKCPYCSVNCQTADWPRHKEYCYREAATSPVVRGQSPDLTYKDRTVPQRKENSHQNGFDRHSSPSDSMHHKKNLKFSRPANDQNTGSAVDEVQNHNYNQMKPKINLEKTYFSRDDASDNSKSNKFQGGKPLLKKPESSSPVNNSDRKFNPPFKGDKNELTPPRKDVDRNNKSSFNTNKPNSQRNDVATKSLDGRKDAPWKNRYKDNEIKPVITLPKMLPSSDGFKPPSVVTSLTSGQELTFAVTVVESETVFWAQADFLDFHKKLLDLEKQINAETSRAIYNAVAGEVVAAYSSSLCFWYRAYVISHNGSQYRVRYVDYGNEEDSNRISPLKAEIQDIPSIVVYLTVEGCPNPTVEAILKKIIQPDSRIKARVQSVNNGVKVELLNPKDNSAMCRAFLYPWHHRLSKSEAVQKPQQDSKTLENSLPVQVPRSSPLAALKSLKKVEQKYYWRELPKIVPTVGQKMNVAVVFTHAEHIYVQPTVDVDKLTNLMSEIKQHCLNMKPYQPQKDEMVCAKYDDGAWYRARALQPEGGQSYKVNFVDYGNDHLAPFEDIHSFTKEFAAHPPFCICVKLHRVSEIDPETTEALMTGEEWTMEVVNVAGECVVAKLSQGDLCINDVLSPEEPVKAAISKVERKFYWRELPKISPTVGQKMNVVVVFTHAEQIYVQPTADNEKLTSLMLEISQHCMNGDKAYQPQKDEMVCAKYDGAWYRAHAMQPEGGQSYKVNFVDYGNDHLAPFEDIHSFTKEFAAYPPFCICIKLHRVSEIDPEAVQALMTGEEWMMEVVNVAGECVIAKLSQGDLCINDVLSPEEPVKIPIPEVEKFYWRELPKISPALGQKMNVAVVFIHAEQIYVQPTADAVKLRNLMSEINQHCLNVNKAYQPQKDEMVCAKYDGAWYRAHALQPEGDQSYKVNFVDYGNDYVASLQDIHSFTKEFAAYSPFCICVKLHRVSEIDPETKEALMTGEEWSMEVVNLAGECVIAKLSQGDLCINDVLSPEEPVKTAIPEPVKPQKIFVVSDLPKTHLKLGQKVQVQIVFMKSASQIYVQDVGTKEKLETLMSQIHKYCCEDQIQQHIPQVKELVCAKFEDGAWYRASVIQPEGNLQFTVHFMDFGNDHVVSVQDIRPFKEEFLTATGFAFCIELDRVTEIDQDASASLQIGEWIMEIVRLDGDRPIVKLSNESLCVNDILGTSDEKTVPVVEKFKIFYKKDLPKPAAKVGQKLAVTAVFLQSAKVVYVQLKSEVEKLAKLTIEIQEHCLKVDCQPCPPQVDEVVCAKFTDGDWYRVYVLKSEGDQSYKVHFVDFGNDHIVSVQDIRPISEELMLYPVSAISIELDRVAELDDATASGILTEAEWVLEIVKLEGERAVAKLSNAKGCINDMLCRGEARNATVPVPKTEVQHKTYLRTDLLSTKLHIGQKLTVQIVFIETAKQVYVQKTTDGENLSNLLSLIHEHCSKTSERYCPQKEEMVCAKYTDDAWYRAHAIQPVGDHSFKVHFVDYGNDHIVSFRDIRPFSQELAAYPVGSICIELHQVSLLDAEGVAILGEGQWTMEIVELDGERVAAKLSNGDVCVNDVLGQDEPLNADIPQHKIEEKVNVFVKSDLPKSDQTVGQQMKVKVVVVNSAKEIFVQQECEQKKLEKLIEEMQEHCFKIEKPYQPKVEEMVCAKFTDGIWYRAYVLQPEGEKSYKVNFVDYGNDFVVSLQDIRPFCKELAALPVGAICMELHKVMTIDEELAPILLEGLWNMDIVKMEGDHVVAKLSNSDVCVNEILGQPEIPEDKVEEKRKVFCKSDLLKTVAPIGQKLDVTVVVLLSSKEVFVQLKSEVEKLVKLTIEIQEHCLKVDDQPYQPQIDEVVCAKFTDGDWYRAYVSKLEGDRSYRVHFVDYGNDHVVSLQDIRPISEELMVHPVSAICIELDRVAEIDTETTAGILAQPDWVMEIVNLQGECVVAKLSNAKCCINDILTMEETSNAAAPDPKAGGDTAKGIFTINDLPKATQPPSLGQKLEVEILFIKSAKELYLQSFEHKEVLREIMCETQDHCTRVGAESGYSNYHPKVGEMVCATFTDGLWYRASVMELESGGSYKVHFVDYGNDHVASAENIRPFSEKLITFPANLICVQLDRVTEIDEETKPILMNGVWIMEVVKLDGNCAIATLSCDGLCVNDLLVTSGENEKVPEQKVCS